MQARGSAGVEHEQGMRTHAECTIGAWGGCESCTSARGDLPDSSLNVA